MPFDRVTGFINSEAGAFAIYYASCYHHHGMHEAYIDVVLDNAWDPDEPGNKPGPERVTFGCRVGPIAGRSDIACSLVDGASVAPDTPLYGRKLDPDAARQHPWISYYWETIDHILEHDATVRTHLYGDHDLQLGQGDFDGAQDRAAADDGDAGVGQPPG